MDHLSVVPQLWWVASLPTLSESRFEHLVSINNWLVRTAGSAVPVVPVRYRSVELLDDEKQLEAMLKTNLLGEGRPCGAGPPATRVVSRMIGNSRSVYC